MTPLHNAVCGLMVEGDEYDLDVEGALEVSPEPCNERIPIVTTGRGWEAVPLDPPMEEGVAARFGAGFDHRNRLIVSGDSIKNGKQVFKTPAFWEWSDHVKM